MDLKRQILALALFLGACFAVAAIGGWFTSMGQPEWYDSLAKPDWTPPSSVFGPVWSVLYASMAVAAWLVWRSPGRGGAHGAGAGGRRAALTLFWVQLVLNLAWSGLFFALRSPGWALGDIILLWLCILGTTILFFRKSRWAGALMVPYLAWVGYAAALNAVIVQLN